MHEVKRGPSLEVRKYFSQQLARIIREKNLSQAEAARIIKTSRDNVNNWLHCQAFPRPNMLYQMAENLGVDLADLVPADMAASASAEPVAFQLIYQTGGKCRVTMDMMMPLEAGLSIASIIRGLE